MSEKHAFLTLWFESRCFSDKAQKCQKNMRF
jgi:hypothetical protein